jgi:hypothetical protein
MLKVMNFPLGANLRLGGVIMVTEEQIKELAHAIWEKEGCPDDKNTEHYFRAKQILEEQEAARVIELAPPPPIPELSPPQAATTVLQPSKHRKYVRRKKK